MVLGIRINYLRILHENAPGHHRCSFLTSPGHILASLFSHSFRRLAAPAPHWCASLPHRCMSAVFFVRRQSFVSKPRHLNYRGNLICVAVLALDEYTTMYWDRVISYGTASTRGERTNNAERWRGTENKEINSTSENIVSGSKVRKMPGNKRAKRKRKRNIFANNWQRKRDQ